MKKIISLILIAVLALSLVACGAPAEEKKDEFKAEDIVGVWVMGTMKQEFKADGTGTIAMSSGITMAADWTYKGNGEFVIGYPMGENKATLSKAEDGTLILNYNGGNYTKNAG